MGTQNEQMASEAHIPSSESKIFHLSFIWVSLNKMGASLVERRVREHEQIVTK